ncbi:MAG: hypothetical protein ACI35O_17220 [Bacillaceae bacterium]
MKKTSFIFIILLVSLFSLVACSTKSESEPKGNKKDATESWELRDKYVKDGKALLTVAPDPTLVAGKPFGYLFHFTAPFETFEGKKLAIYAYHKQTGEKITALSPETIKEPSPGYSTLGRFPVTFSVSKSGLWRYEVVLDDKFYADVVLAVKE